MRLVKLVGVLALIAAFSAIATATASAEVEFLPGTAGTKFTGESGPAKLVQTNGKGVILAKKSKTEGEITSPTTALLVVTFEGCEVAGLACNGLGDVAKTLKVHVEAKTCIVTLSPLVGAVLLKPLPVHIEVPVAKLLILVEGDVIGLLSPVNTKATEFSVILNENGKKLQEDRKCKDGPEGPELTENLIVKDDGVEEGEGAQIVEKGKLVFKEKVEFMT